MNKSQEKLAAARELVSQCDRCGNCLTVCPLFGSRDIESSAARGKNSILRAMADGGLERVVRQRHSLRETRPFRLAQAG